MTNVLPSIESGLDALFASEPTALADPFGLYARVRDVSPLFDHGAMILVTGYDELKAVALDDDRIRTLARKQGSLVDHVRSQLTDGQRRIFDEVAAFEDLFLSRRDGPEHHRVRGTVHRAFSPRRIAELGAATQGYLDILLEEAQEHDVVDLQRIAYELPLRVVVDLLGVPQADRELIHAWTQKIGRSKGARSAADFQPLQEAHAAIGEFSEYIAALLREQRTTAHSAGLASVLAESRAQERLSDSELTAMFVLLLFGGHETTTNLISLGMLALQRAPGAWTSLCTAPELIPDAVEELLRLTSPVQIGWRLPVVDVEVGGVAIAAGTTLALIFAAANWDPRVFPDPERFDVARPNLRAHVGFGFGPHFCLGSALARLEATIAFRTLALRFPDLELATDEIEWTGNAQLRSVVRLPVRLRTRSTTPIV